MKITVCVKFCNGEINPFDASALEYALRIPDAEVRPLGADIWRSASMIAMSGISS